mmetsp:Transcript_15822/g.42674  ORF Transcript_15822/g.42674 Transcript_15822/m.42674 type:complete len:254 (-) Transcript_15822:1030-1791(-)
MRGGMCVMPESLKDSARTSPTRPTVAAAPKPRGVNAAMRPAVPQATKRGSKKEGQTTEWLIPGSAAALAASGIDESKLFKAAERPAPVCAGVEGTDANRRPREYSSAWRFSSCQAICSGRKGLSPAAHGKPSGVPSSWGSRDRRVIGGLDQWGAVTKACSPIATSTRVPVMRKTHMATSTVARAATNFQGCTCWVFANGVVGLAASPSCSTCLPRGDARGEARELFCGLSPTTSSYAPVSPSLISRTMSYCPG